MQNRQLQIWLSDDEYAEIDAEWQEQLALREEVKEKPQELKRYEKKQRDATFQYNRAEGYSNKGKHNTAKTFYNRSESLCEDAIEILQEILYYDSSLRVWCVFQTKLDTESTANWTASPRQTDQLVQSKLITLEQAK